MGEMVKKWTLGDHPRTRGEKIGSGAFSINDVGSPPHARGKGHIAAAVLAYDGITPARAGKSPGESVEVKNWRDHPRTRGEKLLSLSPSTQAGGSPPHARGKAVSTIICIAEAGITPARAGKRTPRTPPMWRTWDHPRTRGEKRSLAHYDLAKKGSPPHARGKDPVHRPGARAAGITPARAGKSKRNP